MIDQCKDVLRDPNNIARHFRRLAAGRLGFIQSGVLSRGTNRTAEKRARGGFPRLHTTDAEEQHRACECTPGSTRDHVVKVSPLVRLTDLER